MNIVKIQQDIIKDLLNNKRGEWFIQIKDSKVYILTRFQVFILSSKEFVLDIDKLGFSNTNIAELLLKSAEDTMPAIKTDIIKSVVSQGKVVNCQEIKRVDNGEVAYVNQNLLKVYDKTCEFKFFNSKNPVFIYEYGILVGIVLPIKV